MIYLTGATSYIDEPALIDAGIGIVVTPKCYWKWAERYPHHGADIGMGYMDADPYLDWLDRVPRERCLYAVSPDAYPDAAESLRRGMQYAGIIREMGFPVALVAQDGAEALTWPWDEFDCLFIGGERRKPGWREWKESAAAEQLCRQARNRGLWVHMGRCNTMRRIERARSMGVNSADGTFVKYRRRRRQTDHSTSRDRRGVAEIDQWLTSLRAEPMLPGFDTFEGASHPTHREALRKG